jgi:hypothetical protein
MSSKYILPGELEKRERSRNLWIVAICCISFFYFLYGVFMR